MNSIVSGWNSKSREKKDRRKECHEKVYRIFKESIVQPISNYIIYRIITGFVFTIQLL